MKRLIGWLRGDAAIREVICWLRGHDWKRSRADWPDYLDHSPYPNFRVCWRCFKCEDALVAKETEQ